MFSKALLGTDKKKTKLSWFDYYFSHCWMTGWQSIRSNFRIWSDLITSNYSGYSILKEDNPEEECINCFWTYLNEDDTYPKYFLEELMQMVDDIETGKIKPVPFTREMFDKIDDLVGDLFDDLHLDEDLEDESL